MKILRGQVSETSADVTTDLVFHLVGNPGSLKIEVRGSSNIGRDELVAALTLAIDSGFADSKRNLN